MAHTTRLRLVALLCLVLVFCFCIPSVQAFGAGNVPSFSYMEGKAFRHGDIEDILADLAKKMGGGLLGRNSKFGGLDVKRVYFGNFLRDYSQAMDIAALEKLSKQTILNIVMVLAFLSMGYATQEFEVTSDRLGVYLPTEHIDNPKGYGDGKNAKQFDERLRGPVDPRELEVDPRSGMKNYIANEQGSWDTSSALVRRTLIKCIQMGRQARHSGDEKTLFEAYRLLGQSLHTLEDFTAHSNWCELALFKLGHRQVFLHVGDNVKIRSPDGNMVSPLVTGTFGSADFMHSLLGEAQDHLSEASVSDLSKAVNQAKSSGSNPLGDLMGMLGSVPGASSSTVSRDAEQLSRGPSQDPNTMSPQEVYQNLFRILSFRDSVMMSIEKTIERIPGLSSLVEKISNTMSVFVFTLIEPYVQPIVRQALSGLHQTSGTVINKEDQFEVFNDPNASDPTHSMLSKDHFNLVLNEVAGRVALIIVKHAVTLVVKAWDNDSLDANQVADECLAPMFHPDWYDPRSGRGHPVQGQMMGLVETWARENPREIAKLDREHVRAHTNTRSGKAEPHSHGNSSNSNYGGVQIEGQQGSAMGHNMANSFQSYVGGKIGGALGTSGGGGYANQAQHLFREAPDGTMREEYGQVHSTGPSGEGHSSAYYQSSSSSGGGGGGGGGGGQGAPVASYSSSQDNSSGYPGAQPHHGQHGGSHHGSGHHSGGGMPNEQHYLPPSGPPGDYGGPQQQQQGSYGGPGGMMPAPDHNFGGGPSSGYPHGGPDYGGNHGGGSGPGPGGPGYQGGQPPYGAPPPYPPPSGYYGGGGGGGQGGYGGYQQQGGGGGGYGGGY